MRLESILALVVAVSAFHGAHAQTEPSAGAQPEKFPEIVARVNDTEIEKAALLRRAEALKSQLPPQEVGPDFYHRVLDDMVSAELLYQAVEEKGIAPTEAEVDTELANQKEQLGGEAAFQQVLDAQGLSVEEVRGELKKEIGIQKLIERDFLPRVEVTEEEKRAFYDENSSEMERPAQFKVAHILIRVEEDATPEAKAEAKKKAESLRGMVEAGQDFADLARRNSDDPGSKEAGGELPWMSQGQTVPAFEAAVRELEPGELSGVVETPFGFHIIRLEDRRAAGVMSYDEVEGRIGEFLERRELQEQIQAELETLRAESTIEVFI